MGYLTTEAERKYHKRYYKINREKLLDYAKRYREEHREQVQEAQKKYSMTHDRSEYHRQYYLRNKERYHQRYLARKERNTAAV